MTLEIIYSFNLFKSFMLSRHVLRSVNTYCANLSDDKWDWFYHQMKRAYLACDDIDLLLFVLQWIVEYDFDDLIYEMYVYDMNGSFSESLISDSYWEEYIDERDDYHELFMNSFYEE